MRKCSECGRDFCIDYPGYTYKVNGKYQCSYTCHDHALLRLSNNQYISEENYMKYVNRSERTMVAQGKSVLHPIKIKYGKVKD